MEQGIPNMVLELDQKLFDLVGNIDILTVITPVNFKTERARFFDSRFSLNPEFSYAVEGVAAFQKKRALYALEIEKINDSDLQELYASVIESYVDKVDQYSSTGTPEFLYNSLRYFGEPSVKDLRNAQFILHLPDQEATDKHSYIDAKQIRAAMEAFAEERGYAYEISLEDSMIANALVSGIMVKINRHAMLSRNDLTALLHHELGVHLVTTLNARAQTLKVLSLGSPVNTRSQEGLAILAEYLSGSLTISRLKTLALRVMAVDSMIKEKDFRQTFMMLKEDYKLTDDKAFTITARVYRGGGFTKDYLYLQGLSQILNAYESRSDFNNLLVGKVSLEQLTLISRLVEKGYIQDAKYITPALTSPGKIDDQQRFIAHALK